jgi:hypothetical protein
MNLIFVTYVRQFRAGRNFSIKEKLYHYLEQNFQKAILHRPTQNGTNYRALSSLSPYDSYI